MYEEGGVLKICTFGLVRKIMGNRGLNFYY
jgi:hypothetical protein